MHSSLSSQLTLQQQTAAALARDKYNTKRRTDLSLSEEMDESIEKMRAYKRSLTRAIQEHNSPLVEHYIDLILKLRAEQIAITLEQEKDEGGTITEERIAQYITAYTEECNAFISSMTST